MALIQGYYDVGEAPEIDSIKKGLGNYLARRIKENKESLARQMKAADPSYELEVFKQDAALLRELEKQYNSMGAKTSGGNSVSYTQNYPNPKDKFNAKQNMIDNQTRQADDFAKSDASVSGKAGRIQGLLIDKVKGADVESKDGVKLVAQRVTTQLQNFMGDRSEHRSTPGKHAFGLQVMQQASGLPKRTRRVIEATLKANGALPSKEDIAIYADPQNLSERQKAELRVFDQGTGSKRTTEKQMGAGIDPNTMGAEILRRIKQQREIVAASRQRYDRAATEYRSLAAGPDYNIALASPSRRPTALTDSMRMYTDLRSNDPRYARDMREASREEGGLVMPDRYTGISVGKSPIDSLLDTTDNLASLRGRKFDAPGPGEFGVKNASQKPRDFDVKDVDAVKNALKSMMSSVESPLFTGQDYSKISSQGELMDMKEYLSSGIKLIEELEVEDPQIAAQAAQDLSDELIDWRESQDQEMISSSREQGDPRRVLSDSVNVVKGALRDYEVTGDQKQLSATLNEQRNAVISTNSENLGDAGSEYTNIIENFAETGDVGYFDNQLTELQMATQEPYFEGA